MTADDNQDPAKVPAANQQLAHLTDIPAAALPAILTGHQTPALAEKVRTYYMSVAEIFELWVKRRNSPHTQRAYRGDVMGFVAFMELAWPTEATRMLTVKISDVLAYVDYMKDECGQAPKTINRRIASLSSFYKYLAGAAAELRLPITVPNPAHAQFVARQTSDPVDETKAMNTQRARQLMNLPGGDDLLSCRDRAILKLYLYTGIRLTTGCRLKVSDFHVDEDGATLKVHEKGNKRRTIGINHIAAEALQEYLQKAGLDAGPLFRAQASSKNKERLSDKAISSPTMYRLIMGYLCRLTGAMKKDQNEAGETVEFCIYTPHSIRATTATLLLDQGTDIRKVQELLGHQHITTTQIYDKRRLTTNQSASHDLQL